MKTPELPLIKMYIKTERCGDLCRFVGFFLVEGLKVNVAADKLPDVIEQLLAACAPPWVPFGELTMLTEIPCGRWGKWLSIC